MGYGLHDARNLIRCGYASYFAFGADRGGELVLVGLEYGSLVQANGGCVDAHVGKDNVGIGQASGELEMCGEAERRVEENIVHLAMAFPKRSVHVIIEVVFV